MKNLKFPYLPKFSDLDYNKIEPKLADCLARNKVIVANLLHSTQPYSWDNLIYPLDDLDEELQILWSPISHLNAVMNSESLRQVYHHCLPMITEYETELAQNEELYRAVKMLANSDDYQTLTYAQKKVIDNAIKDFYLAGVTLPAEKKQQFKDIQLQLSKLANQFEDNLLDATNAWHKHITNSDLLAGLPEYAMQTASELASQQSKQGWLLTLEYPCYDAVMHYADNRELRQEMYKAYSTRASDQGPDAGKWDHSQLMDKIVLLRHELAKLLEFSNFAEYSFETKMAKTSKQVQDFLLNLANRCRAQAEEEYAELAAFMRQQSNLNELEVWDIAYYSEKLRQYRYNIAAEELRPYFPQNKVTAGMFTIVERLYGITLEEYDGADVWHPDVKFFNLFDETGELRGHLYMDLYARPKKRGGAWMDSYVGRRRLADGTLQLPIAFLTCNFAPPTSGKPALFSHEEVITLFHEFGHCLHHLLTTIDYPGVAGINGVKWDAVELPSQFFESWCWEPEALTLISGHYQTRECLPEVLINRLREAKNFQSAMQLTRQIEFSLFDLRLHTEFEPSKGMTVQSVLDQVRQQVSVVPVPSFNRFQHSFSHIFAGGYAAAYYSYKWAELLASDAFARFEEEGIFNPATGRSFLHHILEQGGARDPMELFVAFRGREPTIDALLRHSGIDTNIKK